MIASEVLDLLRRHYLPEGRPPGGLFADEIASPDGRRRADLIWVPTSMAGRHSDHMIGHEIKVSRSDVITELNDPTKTDPWAQFCTRWWLVIPDPALIDGLDVPEMWGVMAPPSGRRTRSMTIVKAAPKLTPTGDFREALTRLTAFMVNRVATSVTELEREVAWRQRTIDRHAQQIEEMRAAGEFGRLAPHAKRLNTILTEVQRRSRGLGWWVRDASDEAIIQALVDHQVMTSATRSAQQELETIVRQVTEPLSHTREALKAAKGRAEQIEMAS